MTFGPLASMAITAVMLLVPVAIVLAVVLGTLHRKGARDARQHLRDTGVRGTGKVISSRQDPWAPESAREGVTREERRRAGNVYRVELEVQMPGRPPFVTALVTSVAHVHLPAIAPGATVAVVADPANPSSMVIDFRVLRDPSLRAPLPPCSPVADPSRLHAMGLPGQARVLGIRPGMSHLPDSDRTYGVELVLEVQAPGGAPYLAHMLQRVHEMHLPQVQAGCLVHARIDPADPRQVVVVFA